MQSASLLSADLPSAAVSREAGPSLNPYLALNTLHFSLSFQHEQPCASSICDALKPRNPTPVLFFFFGWCFLATAAAPAHGAGASGGRERFMPCRAMFTAVLSTALVTYPESCRLTVQTRLQITAITERVNWQVSIRCEGDVFLLIG